jgi:hypothetical protein
VLSYIAEYPPANDQHQNTFTGEIDYQKKMTNNDKMDHISEATHLAFS